MFGLFLGFKVKRSLRRGPEAAAALGPKAARHLVRLLDDKHLRANAAEALVRLGAAARKPLYARMDKGEGLIRVIGILGRLRPRTDPGKLIPFLRHPAPAVRRAAAKAISRQGGGLAHKALGAALADDDAGVRDQALRHFIRTQDPRAVKVLIEVAAHGDEASSRLASARILSLGYLAVTPLVESLRTADEDVRYTIAYLLDGFNDPDSLVIMSKGLEEDDARIWQVVKDAFLRKGPETAPVLAPLAGHPDPRVRQTALVLLERWGTPQSPVATLLQDKTVTQQLG